MFVLTLAVSVGGGLLLVAAQIMGLLFGASYFTEMINVDVKPWIVGTSAACAMFSFVLMYLRGDGKKNA
ncbi:hypothetical protein D1J51_11250 [Leucobacter sp. wl10]|nr:hypothetical protein D1J51_11250 [Leucobacter sp. wl10]